MSRVRLGVLAGSLVILVIVAVVIIRASLDTGSPSAGQSPVLPPTTTSTSQPTPTSGLPPKSTTTTATPGDPFNSDVESFVSQRQGTITGVVQDLNGGQVWTLGTGGPQDEASVVKVAVLEQLLAQQPDGSLPGSNDANLAQEMIENSDDDATTALWTEIGGSQAMWTYDDRLGLTNTTPSSCVECPGFPWPGWGLTTTTPSDELTVLRQLVEPNAFLNDDQRDYALQLMENVNPSERWGVTGGVPSQVTVALKNGWLPLNPQDTDWQINSVGWVSGLGRNYLLAIFTTGNPSEDYGIDTINQISAQIWSAMG